MDEWWRVPIGSVVLRPRSTEQTRMTSGSLGAADFRDVFGGPPRSVLLRQYSGVDAASPSSSASLSLDPHLHRDGNEYWLRPPRVVQHGGKGGRRPPDFSVPAAAGGASGGRWVVRTEEGFYDDIFESGGGDGDRIMSRTRSWQSSKSKSTSSSVVSSEDRSDSVGRPRVPLVDDDAVLSSFSSKLRPIIVPPRRPPGGSPSPTVVSTGEQSRSWKASTASCARLCFGESRFEFEDILTRPKVDGDPYNRPLLRLHSSPPAAAASLEPVIPVAGEVDSGGGSPSSGVSSVYDDIPMATIVPLGAHERAALRALEREVRVALEDEIEAEVYGTIEIVPGGKASMDAEWVGAVDEAIAWAKEKFGAASSSPAETGVGDDEHEQRSEAKEEEQGQGHANKTVDGHLIRGRDHEGLILDVVTHQERFRGVRR